MKKIACKKKSGEKGGQDPPDPPPLDPPLPLDRLRMYETAKCYGLHGAIHNMLDTGVTPTKSAWKLLVNETVRGHYHRHWRMLSMLYKSLDLLRECSSDTGKVALWWRVSRANPRVARQCRLTVKLLCGDLSLNSMRGQFINQTTRCMLCGTYEEETAIHTLFVCSELADVRKASWTLFSDQAPQALVNEVSQVSFKQRLVFLLSGFRSPYIREWQPIYEVVAQYIFAVCQKRLTMIKSLQCD